LGYTYLTHTADLRARLEGADGDGLYQTAVDLVRETVVGDSPVEAREERRWTPPDDDAAECFFRFVRELVFFYDVDGFLPVWVRMDEPIVIAGECFDPIRHASERQIKAVTRHGYRFSTDDGWHAELIFDL
jgi:SHS2 domain-containing protein